MHSLITNEGLIVDFDLAATSYHDVVVAEELLDRYQNIMVVADKGYVSERLKQNLGAKKVKLLAMKRKNQAGYNAKINKAIGKVRCLVETVFSQLTDQFNISRVLAKSPLGLKARLYTKITAHTIAFYLNKLFGLPVLNMKGLIFN